MEKSIGYEITYAANGTPQSLSAKILYLTFLKSGNDEILALSIDNFNSLFLITVTEKGLADIDTSKLGKVIFKNELLIYNISLKDDVNPSIIEDIKEQNMYYFYNDTKEPYPRIIKNVYDGIDKVASD